MLRSLGTGLCVLGLLSGCGMIDEHPKASAGALLGGVLGGVAGAQFGAGAGNAAMTGAGILVGAALLGEVGARLDSDDARTIGQTTLYALTSPEPRPVLQWQNPGTGSFGQVTVAPVPDAQDCRQYHQSVTVGDRKLDGLGVACRDADGDWFVRP